MGLGARFALWGGLCARGRAVVVRGWDCRPEPRISGCCPGVLLSLRHSGRSYFPGELGFLACEFSFSQAAVLHSPHAFGEVPNNEDQHHHNEQGEQETLNARRDISFSEPIAQIGRFTTSTATRPPLGQGGS